MGDKVEVENGDRDEEDKEDGDVEEVEWPWGDVFVCLFDRFEVDQVRTFGFSDEFASLLLFRERLTSPGAFLSSRRGFDVMLVSQEPHLRLPLVYRQPDETDERLVWRVMRDDFGVKDPMDGRLAEDPALPSQLRKPAQLTQFFLRRTPPGTWFSVTALPSNVHLSQRRVIDYIQAAHLSKMLNPVR